MLSKKRRFAMMYNKYADDIFRFLLVRVNDQALAEDLTADTFAKAWASIDKFDFKQPRPWLYTIANNTMRDNWRKKQPVFNDEEVEAVSDAKSPEENAEIELSKEKLSEALSKLPKEMQAVVSLRFISGYSAKKTAESLGMTEGNVRVVQYRALKKLKGML